MSEQEQMPPGFYEIFDASFPRLGPGDNASTVKALRAVLSARAGLGVTSKDTKLKVLDLGCGAGVQTIQLAKLIDGTILAVDNHQPYLAELQRRAQAAGVSHRIEPRLGDMRTLNLEEGSFDIIWSEGALYCMGFREGLRACRRWLAPNGFLAVTELCWLKPGAPAECRDFFAMGYPDMADVDANLSAMQACGYTMLDHFVLPESAWWDTYYRPLEERLRLFRQKCAEDPGRLALIESLQMEIDIYRSCSGYYGYVFYLMRR